MSRMTQNPRPMGVEAPKAPRGNNRAFAFPSRRMTPIKITAAPATIAPATRLPSAMLDQVTSSMPADMAPSRKMGKGVFWPAALSAGTTTGTRAANSSRMGRLIRKAARQEAHSVT